MPVLGTQVIMIRQESESNFEKLLLHSKDVKDSKDVKMTHSLWVSLWGRTGLHPPLDSVLCDGNRKSLRFGSCGVRRSVTTFAVWCLWLHENSVEEVGNQPGRPRSPDYR